MTTETPIRRQYLEIKAKHRNAILLFRLGDFYEAFDEDAKLLARELDITLTSKQIGKGERVPLAGVPHYVLERHLATLIARGHRVAICEQTSSAAVKGDDGKKLIQRQVVRIVTAGTVIEPQLLDSKTNNYLASFFSDGRRTGIAYADITTGDFAATEVENRHALDELSRLSPAEIIIAETQETFSNQDLPQFVTKLDAGMFAFKEAEKSLLEHFSAKTLKPFGLENTPLAVSAAGALVNYLNKTQSGTAEQLTRLTSYDFNRFMLLDANTLRSLEIFDSSTGASLLSVIDRTQTSMGGRLLRKWLRQPLLDVAEIFLRQEHVAWFKENSAERENLRRILAEVKDLERLSSRAKANYISAYELRVFSVSLDLIPPIKKILQKDAIRFGQLLVHLPECAEIKTLIENGISDEIASRHTEQIGIIRDGFSEELDKLRELLRDGRSFLAEMEKRERKRTGIKSLRVGFNKVFGYYIEVTKPNLHLVPPDYTRKQTLLPAERYITLELKEHESMVVHAQERILELENILFRQICQKVGEHRREILLAASSVAFLDAVSALADVADRFNYSRPTVNETSLLRIKNGRHAVVEKILSEKENGFIPNDTALGGNGAPQIALITGPNASGKSTYLRQIALIVLLAQIGSFVPADDAVVGICDRIFTRIGLYDKIGSGESTFMTEMIETAEILHHASPNSLILLDELGRGTSTYDGLAVARSVLEFIHNHPKLKSRTLFATHYHELSELEELLPKLENYFFVITEHGDKLTFEYKIAKGTALKSYGVYVSKLAGLPKPVVRRAAQLLEEYEIKNSSEPKFAEQTEQSSEIDKILKEIDVDALSPVEALMKIYELKKLSDDEKQQKQTLKRAFR
ncbi:MAG TPA: DNA mismatch repair protein MutS [Pyrinomonadaceae bacterium]|nr:DNA mismatch repair protein MutS [Pyrinomonadaceae bacterium]